jgi:hypothetical protein
MGGIELRMARSNLTDLPDHRDAPHYSDATGARTRHCFLSCSFHIAPIRGDSSTGNRSKKRLHLAQSEKLVGYVCGAKGAAADICYGSGIGAVASSYGDSALNWLEGGMQRYRSIADIACQSGHVRKVPKPEVHHTDSARQLYGNNSAQTGKPAPHPVWGEASIAWLCAVSVFVAVKPPTAEGNVDAI